MLLLHATGGGTGAPEHGKYSYADEGYVAGPKIGSGSHAKPISRFPMN